MAEGRFRRPGRGAMSSGSEPRKEPLNLFPRGEVRRLNVNLSVDELEQLKGVARATGQTMTGCVKAALSLLARAVEEERQGNSLAFVSDDGELIQEVRVTRTGRPASLRVKTGTRAGMVVTFPRHE